MFDEELEDEEQMDDDSADYDDFSNSPDGHYDTGE